jgi:hypothetical protein
MGSTEQVGAGKALAWYRGELGSEATRNRFSEKTIQGMVGTPGTGKCRFEPRCAGGTYQGPAASNLVDFAGFWSTGEPIRAERAARRSMAIMENRA